MKKHPEAPLDRNTVATAIRCRKSLSHGSSPCVLASFQVSIFNGKSNIRYVEKRQ